MTSSFQSGRIGTGSGWRGDLDPLAEVKALEGDRLLHEGGHLQHLLRASQVEGDYFLKTEFYNEDPDIQKGYRNPHGV